MKLQDAKDEADSMGAAWLAMDASGELWCGYYKPEYHAIWGIWVWLNDVRPVKIGWIYPVKEWRDCRWSLIK